MGRYVKENPRINVKFIDSDTDEELFEVNDRNHLNVGELFPSSTVNNIVQRELKNRKNLPKNIMVIAVSEYTLND
jgi:hypothetical protein